MLLTWKRLKVKELMPITIRIENNAAKLDVKSSANLYNEDYILELLHYNTGWKQIYSTREDFLYKNKSKE